MRYVCPICGYVYDEAVEGVPFESLPDSWSCPLCGAPKLMFEPEAAPQVQADPPGPPARAGRRRRDGAPLPPGPGGPLLQPGPRL